MYVLLDYAPLFVYNNLNNKQIKSILIKEVFSMRTTRKVLEAKVNNYNSISNVKLKLNDDVVGAINLYTEDNNRIATATNKEMLIILDALINIKALETCNR